MCHVSTTIWKQVMLATSMHTIVCQGLKTAPIHCVYPVICENQPIQFYNGPYNTE